MCQELPIALQGVGEGCERGSLAEGFLSMGTGHGLGNGLGNGLGVPLNEAVR